MTWELQMAQVSGKRYRTIYQVSIPPILFFFLVERDGHEVGAADGARK